MRASMLIMMSCIAWRFINISARDRLIYRECATHSCSEENGRHFGGIGGTPALSAARRRDVNRGRQRRKDAGRNRSGVQGTSLFCTATCVRRKGDERAVGVVAADR